jgi:hypothetical protein
MRRTQSGNAMIYILIALGLIGLLTATMMRQDSTSSDDLSAEQAEFQALQILEYATAAQNVMNQMIITGTNPDDIDFMLPSAASFNTAPHHNKFFHPQGGGLNYKEAMMPPFVSNASTPGAGWHFTKRTNVGWTPTSAPDIILTARSINPLLCQTLNKKITGNSTIVNTDSMADLTRILTIHGPLMNLTIDECPDCENHTQLCVQNGPTPDFYTVILAR